MSQTTTTKTATTTSSENSAKMSSPKPGVDPVAGRVGHLTSDQTYKLKEAYLAMYIALGLAPKNLEVAGNAPEVEVKKGRLGFGRTELVVEDNLQPAIETFRKALKELKPENVAAHIDAMRRTDLPDQVMLRFLRARKWDVAKALNQLGETIHWRMTEGDVDDLVRRGEVYYIEKEPNEKYINLYKKGLTTVHGSDKQGRPIVKITVRKHNPRAQSSKDMENYTVSIIESSHLCLYGPVETAAVIFDLTDFTLSNMDYGVVRFLIKCFENHYPESLGYLFIHKAPWVFGSVWNIIKGWIDPVVASKISFTNKTEDLLPYIDIDELPKDLGGNSPFEFEYIAPQKGEDDLMKDTATRDKLQAEHRKLCKEFHDITLKWTQVEEGPEAEKLAEQRKTISEELVVLYRKLDPYIRARCIADRNGSIKYFDKFSDRKAY